MLMSLLKACIHNKKLIMNILDQYIKTHPSDQNALDIFKGEWSSKMPPERAELQAGGATLFDDARITWAAEQLNGFQDVRVLELGPLEGGHSYMLEKMGVQSILSIESNTRAYLKCLISKEIFNLSRTHFILGDFIPYLQQTQDHYDFCLASGVLYHMKNPVELIALIAKCADSVMFFTHYYQADIIENDPKHKGQFTGSEQLEYQGFKHVVYKQNYREALGWLSFCGGNDQFSMWMSKSDILACLEYFGFSDIRIGFDSPQHPNGPCFCITARRVS